MDYKLLKKIFLDLFKIDKVKYKKIPVLTVAHDNDRGYLYNGRYYSQLIDSIEDDLKQNGIQCLSVARIISSIKGDIAYGDVVSPEGAFARALITKRLKGLFNGKKYPYSHMEERIWGHILDETGAKKVIAILPSRELCVACHKRGIWVADVQHGVIANRHYWYGVDFRGNDPKNYLPSAFLVWDEPSAQVLEKYCIDKDVDVIRVGNRWVARFVPIKPADNMAKEIFHKERLEDTEKKTILVTLSWGMMDVVNGIIPSSLVELIKETSKEYRWLLRLHPNQLKGFATNEFKIFIDLFNAELKNHAEWERPSYMSLPVLLLQTDLHISWISSTAIEASQMGIKSAMLDSRLRTGEFQDDYYEYYRNKGMVDFIENDKEIIKKWIELNVSVDKIPDDYTEFNENYNKVLLATANVE
ncbi:hypothetical protein [Sphingobacterium bovistauri]|uniref:CDP-Glycerol:Poly(Glycerophosphate) glycerophosphotransferase n=1 Tax=Sphingobacterium bovistauri TaxID=2781959 RepID=A0ABS7Z551_9SPHI|nr:hypothetical protein [Sphingobacterium bovistauri]MCA5004089.1 hypothetical protein [Sphingobacterium bovistauri]